MPGLGTVVILLVANVIWLLLNLFASCALKLSGEGANRGDPGITSYLTIYGLSCLQFAY